MCEGKEVDNDDDGEGLGPSIIMFGPSNKISPFLLSFWG